MKKQIEISEELYKRLESHSVGFDTPQNVIEKMVDFFEGHSAQKSSSQSRQQLNVVLSPSHNLDIVFYPNDEDHFKAQFLAKKVAWILLTKTDGTKEIKTWEGKRFSRTSSVKGNLLSGQLRNWRQKGITKAELSVNKDDLE